MKYLDFKLYFGDFYLMYLHIIDNVFSHCVKF